MFANEMDKIFKTTKVDENNLKFYIMRIFQFLCS